VLIMVGILRDADGRGTAPAARGPRLPRVIRDDLQRLQAEPVYAASRPRCSPWDDGMGQLFGTLSLSASAG